ncbi:MAG: Uma2 family endonuclease [Clostridia bacterium]|nr:Uma2 family endonuclease [Clostridia bacterium]
MSEAVKLEKKTIEDYYALPEGTRAELIDGVIYDMSPPGALHQIISMGLSVKVYNYIVGNKGKCRVLAAPFGVKLSEDTVVEPDITVVCDRNKITHKWCEGAPDWIVEIVSSNAFHDYVRKLNLYAISGVREYWIVDPKKETVNVYLLDENYAVKQYQFSDDVPVSIYNGELKINIAELLSE